LVYLPAGQSGHEACALVCAYLPSAQSLHTNVVLLVVEYCCLNIVLHCPTTPMNWPAGQLEHADRS
jgi:hypothetical protein